MTGVRLLDLLFPPACVGCRELMRFEGFARQEVPSLCPACAAAWADEAAQVCGVCLLPVSGCTCPTEEMTAAHIAEFRKLAYYRHGTRDPIPNRIVYRIKEYPDRRAVRFFAVGMAEAVEKMLADRSWTPEDTVLVWLPRGAKNRMRTGTDQAKRLAREISDLTGIPALSLIVRLPGQSREQKALSVTARKQNAKAAFRLSETNRVPAGTHVILVDDIVTTGASMAAAARLLRHAGVKEIAAVAALSDDANRNGNEKQPILRGKGDVWEKQYKR